jgi:hypothetical protein
MAIALVLFILLVGPLALLRGATRGSMTWLAARRELG